MASPPDLHDPSTLTHINRREILSCNPCKRIARSLLIGNSGEAAWTTYRQRNAQRS